MRKAKMLFMGIVCLLCMVVLQGRVMAQDANTPAGNLSSDVHGTVLSMRGSSLAGVTVTAVERSTGRTFNTITDSIGDFTFHGFRAGEKYDFQFSIVGYEKNDYPGFVVKAKGKNTLMIRLTEKSNQLDEVVVVGYGVQKKVNLTGAVSTVDTRTFEDRPVSSPAQALQGAIPNLNITFGDGHPGSTGTFNVRGFASVSNTTGSPLIFIQAANR
jgi:hypothetical protein